MTAVKQTSWTVKLFKGNNSIYSAQFISNTYNDTV